MTPKWIFLVKSTSENLKLWFIVVYDQKIVWGAENYRALWPALKNLVWFIKPNHKKIAIFVSSMRFLAFFWPSRSEIWFKKPLFKRPSACIFFSKKLYTFAELKKIRISVVRQIVAEILPFTYGSFFFSGTVLLQK